MSLIREYGFPMIMRAPEGVDGSAGGLPAGSADGGQADAPDFRDPLDVERQGSKRSIRDELNHQFSEARKADPEDKPAAGRFGPNGARKAAVAGAKPAGEKDAGVAQTGAAAAQAGGEAALGADGDPAAKTAEVIAPPKNLDKAALADWEKAPESIKKTLLRREEEMAKGVEELKGRYAALDGALAPHMEAIRRHGHTPDQAVGQLFSWFQALATNPKAAFPALAKSFGQDLAQFAPAAAAPAAQAAAAAAAVAGDGAAGGAAQPAFELPAEYKQLMDGTFQKMTALEQQLSQLQSGYQAESQAKTQQIIENWSKDKPHFADVRVMMSQLIQSGVVPLKDGNVDLDGAYEAAIYANPAVRAKLQADDQQKVAAAAEKARTEAAAKVVEEQKAQQAAADRARVAGRGLSPAAPGASSAAAAAGKPKKGLSVKESLRAAIAEVGERA